jgi:UDP-N-acetylmuramyl pentapeptide phosphotransferase/UDP-N-acetylglucosamine-1-phosphate transferase
VAILASVGLGLGVGWVTGLLGAATTLHTLSGWVLAATGVLAAVSFLGDRIEIHAACRFGCQVLCAASVVIGSGIAVSKVSLPMLGVLPLGIVSIPATILLLVWMANLYNFMDGMDGFAGGMTVSGYAFIGYASSRAGELTLGTTATLIAAAAAGFLCYNWPPAKIFMGDVGSVPLGFLAGVLIVIGIQRGLFDVWAPLLAFSPFVADASATLARRLWRREKVWQAHREHFYQRLVLVGWGHRRTVLVEYALMLGCGLSAAVYLQAPDPTRRGLLILWLAVYVCLGGAVRALEATRGQRA